MSKIEKSGSNNIFDRISDLLRQARQTVVKAINDTMVITYFEIGKMIVEEEQAGKERAEYGKQLIIDLSKRLSKDFGKGFSVTNIQQMRNFYLIYQKQQTLSAKFSLSWSHYLKLMRIDNENERRFYEVEAINNGWSLRELQRQFDSALYERLALSKDKDGLKELAEKGQIIEKTHDALKDPYILEFVGLQE